MNIKTFNSQYDLVEFHHYINQVNDKTVNIVELLLNYPIDEFYESDFESIFVIEEEKQTHVFSWYEVDEFYEEDGLLKVILVK